MSLRGESGWQTEKTLAECMRYTLENEIATDVIFEVGPPGGATIDIHAHKWMLMSRSAVFEAMFSSGMVECRGAPYAKIRVVDIDAAIFQDLLLYVYCEVVSVSVETAGALMYAANKYLLPKLARECGKCLAENLTVDNVIHVLEQGLLLDDTQLRSDCLELIEKNANAVLTGKEINTASPQTMETIMSMDKLPVKEVVIYATCLAWAKQQLRIQQSVENPTDQQIRETLGSLLYKIRFPVMKVAEFAEISESQNVLTAEEKAPVSKYIATEEKGSQLIFPTKRRLSEKVWIARVMPCIIGQRKSYTDSIYFTTDRDILLTGIGLYIGHNDSSYDIEVAIRVPNKSLFKQILQIPSSGDEKQYKVLMDEIIPVKAGLFYEIETSAHEYNCYSGHCEGVYSKGDVAFTFSYFWTDPDCGQIPRIFFRI